MTFNSAAGSILAGVPLVIGRGATVAGGPVGTAGAVVAVAAGGTGVAVACGVEVSTGVVVGETVGTSAAVAVGAAAVVGETVVAGEVALLIGVASGPGVLVGSLRSGTPVPHPVNSKAVSRPISKSASGLNNPGNGWWAARLAAGWTLFPSAWGILNLTFQFINYHNRSIIQDWLGRINRFQIKVL